MNKTSSSTNRPLTYSSATITARRQRILKETRRIIAKSGIEGFSIRELCRQAKVAQHTVYNAFENKNHIIGMAIRDAFDNINQNYYYTHSSDTMEGNLERLIAVNIGNLEHKNYAKAISSLYFSPSTSDDVITTLREMGFINLRQWLDKIHESHELGDWVDRADLELICINDRYATINDWANGRITDNAYIYQLVEGTLLLIAGATTGGTRDNAIDFIKRIRANGWGLTLGARL